MTKLRFQNILPCKWKGQAAITLSPRSEIGSDQMSNDFSCQGFVSFTCFCWVGWGQIARKHIPLTCNKDMRSSVPVGRLEPEGILKSWAVGCPSKTCFLENKKAQPIPVVFGGWFEGSQKDFWFWQVLWGAQGCQQRQNRHYNMFHLMLVVFQSYELKENSSPMKEGLVQSMKEEMRNSED